jgi:hypothetical protein
MFVLERRERRRTEQVIGYVGTESGCSEDVDMPQGGT